MVQGVARQVAPLLATLGSFARGQGFAQYAVPALAGSGKRAIPPLSEPLPDVVYPNPVVPAPPQLQVGAVNGVKAAALDAGGPNSCVGVFVAGGSAAETPATAGAAKLLEYLAFSATTNRTTFRLTRELEKYGAAASAAAGREHIGYVIEGTKLQAAEITEMLLDAVLNMRLSDWEVHDMAGHAAEELAAAYARPGVLVAELLHRAAFSGGLAKPLLPEPGTVDRLTAEALKEYVDKVFTPANMVVAGAGVDLKLLEQVAGPLLPAGGGAAAVPASKYTGGVITAVTPDLAPTVAVAYEAKGGAGDLKAVATAAVLKSLLNESREVLPWMNKAPEGPLTSVTPLVQVYRSTGLVGLLGTTTSGQAAAAADALQARLEALAKGVKEEAVAQAKSLVVGGYSSAVAGKMGMVQDMGGQLLARGSFNSGDYVAAVAGVKAGDITKALGEMLKGQPTLVAAGALTDVPKYDATAKKFV